MIINKYVGPHLAPDTGAEGGAQNGADQLNSLLDGMDAQGDTGAATSDAAESDGDPGQGNADQDAAQEGDSAQDENPNNAAFASMRINNKQLAANNAKMQKSIMAMAKTMGIETDDFNEVMTSLDEKAIVSEAAAEKVPVEVLKRLKDLEARDQVYTRAQLKQSADTEFVRIRTEFGVPDAELIEFARQLDEGGKNPYAVPGVDVYEKYVATNLTKIIDRSVQAALQRAAKGDTHSSNPSHKSGGDGTERKISSVAGLTSLLNGVDL